MGYPAPHVAPVWFLLRFSSSALIFVVQFITYTTDFAVKLRGLTEKWYAVAPCAWGVLYIPYSGQFDL